MTPGFDTLGFLKVRRLTKALADIRGLPGQYRFLSRTPLVDAEEGEIMARWIDRPQIADLVADDAKATVYSSGKFSLETTEVPNIKAGMAFGQQKINLMRRIAAGLGMAEDTGNVIGSIFDLGSKLKRNIQERMEQLCVAMRTDRFSYNRGGLVIPNMSWGMPIELNTVAGTPWYANPSTATPIDNLLQVKLVGSTLFGIDYDRVTMSTAGFRAAIATVEFQNKAKIQLRSDIGYTNLSLLNLQQQQGFMETVLGMKVELNDKRSWTQDTIGLQTSFEFQSPNLVIIESSQYDNDPAAWDFANAVVTESIVSSLVGSSGLNMSIPGMVGEFDGGMRGPVSYCTLASADLNSPGLTMWGVARGFPRKHMLQCSAVLDIGTVVNPIPYTEVFGDLPGY